MRQLRLENAALRAQLQGVRVHEPYAPALPVLGVLASQTEAPVMVGTPRTPTGRAGAGLEVDEVMASPTKATHPCEKGVISPDPKRLRGAAALKGDGL